MGSSDRGCCARSVASTSTRSQIRPWHNTWLPNQAPRFRMLRSQLGGWACQARPLRLNDPLRNVHPESTSWKHQAHEADGAWFLEEGPLSSTAGGTRCRFQKDHAGGASRRSLWADPLATVLWNGRWWRPRLAVSHHRIGHREQFSGTGNQRHFGWLAARDEPLVKPPELRIPSPPT